MVLRADFEGIKLGGHREKPRALYTSVTSGRPSKIAVHNHAFRLHLKWVLVDSSDYPLRTVTECFPATHRFCPYRQMLTQPMTTGRLGAEQSTRFVGTLELSRSVWRSKHVDAQLTHRNSSHTCCAQMNMTFAVWLKLF